MTPEAVSSDSEFLDLAGPYRVELLAHCYRMLGSVTEAEDLVQETYLRAWRSFDSFEGRASVRTWLYRIATNSCLTARGRAATRALPSGLMGPRTDADDQNLDDLDREVTWLQPIADVRLDDACADPAAVVAARAGLRLALVAALQHLPGRQRAVFILREVLKWPASEVAYVLQLSVAAVNSLLQRARRRIAELALDENQVAEPISVEIRRHVDRYAAAFEDGNAASLVALLVEDVTLEMPPIPTWFAGRRAVGRFLGQRMSGPPKTWLTVHTAANTQPAVGLYLRREDGTWHAESLHVLTVTSRGIARIVAFRGPATFTAFQLPTVQGRATEIG